MKVKPESCGGGRRNILELAGDAEDPPVLSVVLCMNKTESRNKTQTTCQQSTER